MSLKLNALAHTKILAQGLYGGKAGTAFLAATSEHILIEAVQFVIEDVKRFIEQEKNTTIRECLYRPWYVRHLKDAEGVFSENKFERQKALTSFFTNKIDDPLSFWQEGVLNVEATAYHVDSENFEEDKKIAKPMRGLCFKFQGSGKLDDTELSTRAQSGVLSINGKRDRIGLIVQYEFV